MKALHIPIVERLRAKGLPTAIEVTYGTPVVPPKNGGSRIYMHEDDDAGDQLGAKRSQKANPRGVGIRSVGIKFVIFAHDTRQGADVGDHTALARQLADMIAAAVHIVVRRDFKSLYTPGRAGPIAIPEGDGWAGRAYGTTFAVDTRISDLTWRGAAAPEGSFTTGRTTLDADGPGTSSALPSATTRTE